MEVQGFLVLQIDDEGELVQHGFFRDRREAEETARSCTFGFVVEAFLCEKMPIVKKARDDSQAQNKEHLLVLKESE